MKWKAKSWKLYNNHSILLKDNNAINMQFISGWINVFFLNYFSFLTLISIEIVIQRKKKKKYNKLHIQMNIYFF